MRGDADVGPCGRDRRLGWRSADEGSGGRGGDGGPGCLQQAPSTDGGRHLVPFGDGGAIAWLWMRWLTWPEVGCSTSRACVLPMRRDTAGRPTTSQGSHWWRPHPGRLAGENLIRVRRTWTVVRPGRSSELRPESATVGKAAARRDGLVLLSAAHPRELSDKSNGVRKLGQMLSVGNRMRQYLRQL